MIELVTRLKTERDELSIKFEKLMTFIQSNSYETLPKIERADLKYQRSYMKLYLGVLARRISRFVWEYQNETEIKRIIAKNLWLQDLRDSLKPKYLNANLNDRKN